MISSEENLRRRLEALNREPLPVPTAAQRIGVVNSPPTISQAQPRPGLVGGIPGLVRRGEVVTNDSGEHLHIVLALDELWCGGAELVAKRHAFLVEHASATEGHHPSPAFGEDYRPPSMRHEVASTPVAPSPSRGGERREHEELSAFIEHFPAKVALIDLETCGFSGSSMFLAGLLGAVDGQLGVELLLARNYAEESAVLESLWQRLSEVELIVTFNGKSFDWPMIVDRSRRHLMHRGRQLPTPAHLDLLHAARRRWRKTLPDCKLQTLEQRICNRRRADDIPGGQIPAAYHEYVRTGIAREMDQILYHNAMDLVTLLDLAMRLAG